MRTLSGEDVPVEKRTVDQLAASLRGRLIGPGDADYEEARRVWNGMIDRRPALVARCAGVDDVTRCVEFAREHQLLVAVRGGGHNVAGHATCDGGIVIDLSAMKGLQLDPKEQRVRVQGGATWGDIDRETQVHGLAAPGGIVSTTGIAGLTLGGGQGWLRRKCGMACDSLLAAEVVTADGQLLRASDTEHPDLFWALKGGGGNFGVVTCFEFRLHPVGPEVMFAGPTYPAEKGREILRGFRDYMLGAPEEVSANANFWTIPATSDFPPHVHGQAVVTVGAVYAGSVEAGRTVLQPLRELDKPILDLTAAMPYTALQTLFDPFFPKGELHYYFKALYLDGLGDDVIDAIVHRAAVRPSPLSMVPVWALGGALSRVDAEATPLGERRAPFLIEIAGVWSAPTASEENIAWARRFWVAMHEFSSGRPNLNFPGFGEEGEWLVRATYGAHYDRLAVLKRKYDPSNLFRLNQNILPASSC